MYRVEIETYREYSDFFDINYYVYKDNVMIADGDMIKLSEHEVPTSFECEFKKDLPKQWKEIIENRED